MSTTQPNQDPSQPYGQDPRAAQQAPGARYGTQPYAPTYGAQPGITAHGDLPEPPKHRRLLTLTLASAGLWALSLLLLLFQRDTFSQAFRESMEQSGGADTGQQLTAEELAQVTDLLTSLFIGTTVVLLLIGLALYALVYFPLRKGKNWARILGIVLAIMGTLSALSGVFSFVTTPGAVGVLASVLSLALVIVNILWLVNAFNPQVASYTGQGRRA